LLSPLMHPAIAWAALGRAGFGSFLFRWYAARKLKSMGLLSSFRGLEYDARVSKEMAVGARVLGGTSES